MRILSAIADIAATTAFGLQPVCAQQHDPLKSAMAIARGLGAEHCELQFETNKEDWTKPELFTLRSIQDYDQSVSEYTLVRVPCWMASYNQGDVYVLVDTSGSAELVTFAVPSYMVVYEDEDNSDTVKSISITGYTAKTSVVLSDFDSEKQEISEYYKIRGLGDASTSATWKFEDGAFVLKRFSIDASYDGEINPTELVEFGDAK